jgi:hypothetical protein
MKKPTAHGMSKAPVKTSSNDLAPLIIEVRGLIRSARHAAATTVNTLQVLTNFEIGRCIVEHEQKGAKRATYGKELLKELSLLLTEEFGRGFSEDNLSNMRRFYLVWKDRIDRFPRSLLGYSPEPFQKPSFALSWSHYVLLLTIRKKDAIVKLTLPPNANIHAREYQLYLPFREMLRQKLLDWVREQETKP